jgi:diadenylate cyclase
VSDFLYYVKETLFNITVIDVIDIIIVSFLLYYTFKFIQERRAAKLAIGLILLLALLLISEVLNMHALNFILSNLFSVGIIALVIVFQPELRSALEKVGGESLRSIRGKMDDETVAVYTECITEVAVAAEQLSQSKTGALMVFERSTKLGDVIRTGTVLDAKPTSFLIGNIFFNKAPLHDGAVIFRDGRIHAAGCFLPLSDNNEIVNDLGTRHRAGIGMSENSDAIVLIVSEETGIISVACDGVLKRGFSRKKLETYLESQLIVKENSLKSKVKSQLTRITKIKKGDDNIDKE